MKSGVFCVLSRFLSATAFLFLYTQPGGAQNPDRFDNSGLVIGAAEESLLAQHPGNLLLDRPAEARAEYAELR